MCGLPSKPDEIVFALLCELTLRELYDREGLWFQSVKARKAVLIDLGQQVNERTSSLAHPV